MRTFALTGGIGMGKSTVAQHFVKLGVPVVDTDDLARQIVAPGQPALQEIVKAFGSALLAPDGTLRREDLARIVFADSHARQRLETITHPRIMERCREQLNKWSATGQAAGGAVIPLLFEIGAEKEFDFVICVACTAATQLRRLCSRGWSPQESEQRLAAQWPVATKMARADFVVWTEGSVEGIAPQLQRILTSN